MLAYNQNYNVQKPNFILGYLTHYVGLNEWTFSFWEGDAITPKDIAKTAQLLKQNFTIASLKFRPDSSKQELVAKQLKRYKIPVIYNKAIYQNAPFQAFNVGAAVGRLKLVPKRKKLQNMQFATSDIVILQEAYVDISPVAGIITTHSSTPLAHVNLRANAWGIPNANLKTAAQDYAKWDKTWVRLSVTEQSLEMRPATASEQAEAEKSAAAVRHVDLPQADIHYQNLDTLNKITLENVLKFGAKTAHLGEIIQAGLPVPNGFGVPFYYYQQHMQANGLDAAVKVMLVDMRFEKDANWRKQALADLQAKIKAAPIDMVAFSNIQQQWKTALKGAPVFVRSSTNAEDLAGFNGAGLYDTVPNVRDSAALEAAIKQVWASLWNERAVNERTFFGIAQSQVYAAVLVQTGVNATAAGVLLTTDIWGHQPRMFTIDAKWGLGMRVVEGVKMAEQILYDTSNDGTRIISRSDEETMLVFDAKGGVTERKIPKAAVIMTEARAKKLGALAQKVETLFPQYTVLDIEWVLQKDNAGFESFYLVQARPYVGKN